MRRKFIAGNWKMNTDGDSARKLAEGVVAGVGAKNAVDVAVCPPFPYLQLVNQIVHGTPVQLGAQNLFPEKDGAYTGEVSPGMLVNVGCKQVILGHSERRHLMGESDAFVNLKVQAALMAGLRVILCVGETLAEREGNQTERIVETQLLGSLSMVTAEQMAKIVIAYEPVWAIGTGKTATPEQAQAVHEFIRKQIASRFTPQVAEVLIIQYGGSVKPDNAAALLKEPDIDGALVGGACLKADQFLAIIKAAELESRL